MSVKAAEFHYSATKRTLVAFVGVLAALVVLDAGDTSATGLFVTLPWLSPLLAALLIALAVGVSCIDPMLAARRRPA